RRLAAVPTLVGIAVILAWPLGAAPAATAAQSNSLGITLDSPAGETVGGAAGVVRGRVTTFGLTNVDGVRAQVVRDIDGFVVSDAAICCATPSSGTVEFGP